ncbi:hypothetical protein GQ53DRAFT_828019 [Thozetella sp. PMI_491]|nr:hypothetical protein GQ53DRAFT_828019 [Thozetella sp. PMI_491]
MDRRDEHAIKSDGATWFWSVTIALIIIQLTLSPVPPAIDMHISRRTPSKTEDILCNGTCLAASRALGIASYIPKASPYPFNDFDVTWNEDDCEQEYDFEEFEQLYQQRRIHKVLLAIQWAHCSANPWPELDLDWCLADWDDGVLVQRGLTKVGETCWWCDLAWYRNVFYIGKVILRYWSRPRSCPDDDKYQQHGTKPSYMGRQEGEESGKVVD